jgi:hypothetical protein
VRTYGRLGTDSAHPGAWTTITTDPSGANDFVWLTTLVQVLLLNRGESPFYAGYGLPAHDAVVQQVAPDFFVALTQQQLAPYFAALLVSRAPGATPGYNINATTNQGVRLSAYVPAT